METPAQIPDPNTDFGDDSFNYDAMPRQRISAGGINEWIFSKLRPKSKEATALGKGRHSNPIARQEEGIKHKSQVEQHYGIPPKGYEIQNGLLFQKKSLAERVRDQIRFPILKSSQSLINGVALILFTVGAVLIYSELPTHPELVIGILIVAISGNIILNNR